MLGSRGHDNPTDRLPWVTVSLTPCPSASSPPTPGDSPWALPAARTKAEVAQQAVGPFTPSHVWQQEPPSPLSLKM